MGTVVPAWRIVRTMRIGGSAARGSGSRRRTAERTRPSVYFGVPLRRVWPWALLVLILLGSAAVRIRLLDVPLDRDEGEYAWMGSLILEGIPPYARAYHGKMPGIYLVYALGLAAFGPTIAAVHLLLAIANALAIVLMFRLA